MPDTASRASQGSERGSGCASFVPRYWTSSSMIQLRNLIDKNQACGQGGLLVTVGRRAGESLLVTETGWQCFITGNAWHAARDLP